MPGLKKFGQRPKKITNHFRVEDSERNNFIQKKLQLHLFKFGFISKSVAYYPYLTELLVCISLLFKSNITRLSCWKSHLNILKKEKKCVGQYYVLHEKT